jgi:hypothetical protein
MTPLRSLVLLVAVLSAGAAIAAVRGGQRADRTWAAVTGALAACGAAWLVAGVGGDRSR